MRANSARRRSVGLSLALSLPRAGFFPFSFSFFSFLERSPAPGVWNQLDKLLSYGGGEGEEGRERRAGARGGERTGGEGAPRRRGDGGGGIRGQGQAYPYLETLPNFGRTLARV